MINRFWFGLLLRLLILIVAIFPTLGRDKILILQIASNEYEVALAFAVFCLVSILLLIHALLFQTVDLERVWQRWRMRRSQVKFRNLAKQINAMLVALASFSTQRSRTELTKLSRSAKNTNILEWGELVAAIQNEQVNQIISTLTSLSEKGQLPENKDNALLYWQLSRRFPSAALRQQAIQLMDKYAAQAPDYLVFQAEAALAARDSEQTYALLQLIPRKAFSNTGKQQLVRIWLALANLLYEQIKTAKTAEAIDASNSAGLLTKLATALRQTKTLAPEMASDAAYLLLEGKRLLAANRLSAAREHLVKHAASLAQEPAAINLFLTSNGLPSFDQLDSVATEAVNQIDATALQPDQPATAEKINPLKIINTLETWIVASKQHPDALAAMIVICLRLGQLQRAEPHLEQMLNDSANLSSGKRDQITSALLVAGPRTALRYLPRLFGEQNSAASSTAGEQNSAVAAADEEAGEAAD